ncbi:hypothetical protein FIV31_02120 [Coxiella endosymbiont of Ornithodoros amblus]|nr:hypothetical protein [Coxiella endosymbiont of Ornithodoros amblus]
MNKPTTILSWQLKMVNRSSLNWEFFPFWLVFLLVLISKNSRRPAKVGMTKFKIRMAGMWIMIGVSAPLFSS